MSPNALTVHAYESRRCREGKTEVGSWQVVVAAGSEDLGIAKETTIQRQADQTIAMEECDSWQSGVCDAMPKTCRVDSV